MNKQGGLKDEHDGPQFYDKVGGKAVVDEALAIMQQ